MEHSSHPESGKSCCAHHTGATSSDEKPFLDPVCGMKVAADPAKAATHAGITYYFCGQRCVSRFKADPAPFLQAAARREVQPVSKADGAAIFTCPMHPEIQQKGPGICPKCGMALEPMEASLDQDVSELRDMSRRFWISLAFTVPLLILSMGDMMPALGLHDRLGMGFFAGIQALLTVPVVLWGGWPFFERAFTSFKTMHLNMFSLIALGSGAAFLFSMVSWLLPSALPEAFKMDGMAPLYFEASAVIVTLVLMGQVLELRARAQTNSAVQGLMKLTPDTTWRIKVDGSEEEIPLDQVQIGDGLRVKPGGRIPVDGEVTEGYSLVDESMLTGESVAVEKKTGAQVRAGTMNQSGSLTLRADKVGRDTLLAHIVQLVNEAGRSRAPIQKLADRVAGWFVPAVIASAALSFLLWSWLGPAPAMANGLVAAVSVLIVACPCALGLATPVSIMLGMGRGAQAGVLIKNADALDLLEKIDVLAIDKTGTLTEGKLKVHSVQFADGRKEAEVLLALASLEAHSEHPLAQAVRDYATEHAAVPIAIDDFQARPGLGIAGTVNGNKALLGSAPMMQAEGVDIACFASFNAACAELAHSVVYLAMEGQAVAALSLADTLKADARAAITALHAAGLHVIILSGDNPATVQAVARQVGVEDFHGGLLPQDKLAIIKQLQQQGRKVAMAGDGINDAPSLTQADVGIAMGGGIDIAINSAAVVLPQGDLQAIVRARLLSRKTMRNIRQNLFFAFVYNFLGVPLAAGVLYPWLGILLSPMLASAAMSLSSVSVIANALRLRHVALDRE